MEPRRAQGGGIALVTVPGVLLAQLITTAAAAKGLRLPD